MRLGLFGLPGAGKGTQAEKMAKHWAIPHISTGDMFRELQKGDSHLAKEIQEILSKGALVPDELVTELAFNRLGQDDCRTGAILDGFPRTLSQAQALQKSDFDLNALLFFKVERSEIVKRLSRRRVCEQCGSIFGPGEVAEGTLKCPRDGNVLIQRADDMPQAITTRLALFEKNLLPVLEFYSSLNLLHYIDGQGSADEVFERIVKLIKDEALERF